MWLAIRMDNGGGVSPSQTDIHSFLGNKPINAWPSFSCECSRLWLVQRIQWQLNERLIGPSKQKRKTPRKECMSVWSSCVGTGSVTWLRPERLRRRLALDQCRRRTKRAGENNFSCQAPHRLSSLADSPLATFLPQCTRGCLQARLTDHSTNTLSTEMCLFGAQYYYHFWATMLYELGRFRKKGQKLGRRKTVLL